MGWATKPTEYEGKLYVYHSGDYHGYKAARDVLLQTYNIGVSVKQVQNGTRKNKNGKFYYSVNKQ